MLAAAVESVTFDRSLDGKSPFVWSCDKHCARWKSGIECKMVLEGGRGLLKQAGNADKKGWHLKKHIPAAIGLLTCKDMISEVYVCIFPGIGAYMCKVTCGNTCTACGLVACSCMRHAVGSVWVLRRKLNNNCLYGTIPKELGNLQNLQIL